MSGEQSLASSRAVEASITNAASTALSVSCLDDPSPTDYYAVYQWVLFQEADDLGVGFNLTSRHYTCTPSQSTPPQCPLGYCADKYCQTCFKPYFKKKAT